MFATKFLAANQGGALEPFMTQSFYPVSLGTYIRQQNDRRADAFSLRYFFNGATGDTVNGDSFFGAENWSISFWVKGAYDGRGTTSGINPFLTALNYQNSTTDRITSIDFDFYGRLIFRHGDVTSPVSSLDLNDLFQAYRFDETQPFIASREWFHVLVTRENLVSGAETKVYLNGILATPTDLITQDVTSTSARVTRYNITLLNAATQTSYQGIYSDRNHQYADLYMIPGLILSPSDFAQQNADGELVPIQYLGPYDNPLSDKTNGFYLPFKETSGYVLDHSGNNNHFDDTTYPNIFSRDITYSIETPFNEFPHIVSDVQLGTFEVNIARQVQVTNGSGSWRGSKSVTSGRVYWEVLLIGAANEIVGVQSPTLSTASGVGTQLGSYGYKPSTGQIIANNTLSAYGPTAVGNDRIGVALNMDAGTVEFYKNGVSMGVAFTNVKEAYSSMAPAGTPGSTNTDLWQGVNFGEIPHYDPLNLPPGYSVISIRRKPVEV